MCGAFQLLMKQEDAILITSAANQQMKNLSALIKKSKERKKQKLFVVEGPKMCFEAPKEWVLHIYVAESFWENSHTKMQLMQYLEKNHFAFDHVCDIVADSVFNAVADTQTPQGIMAVLHMPEYGLSDLMNGEQTHLLILESIQDPGNLGTMVRTGEGAGISGILMNHTTVDIFNPKTVRSTMGSLYRVPFFVVEDLGENIQNLKYAGVRVFAAHLKGTKSYDAVDYRTSTAFMIGNEGNGLSDEIANLADSYIRIPMEGQVESLNAAISATLLMYECNRQRRSTNENLVQNI